MKLNLTRVSTDKDVGTFGVLQWADQPAPFAVCLEDPWANNQRSVSCIPDGAYKCRRYQSPTHGDTFMVHDVPNRSYILFHKGNTHVNTEGCILIGEAYEYIGGVPGIANSKKGFEEFWSRAKDYQEFDLEIHWAGR